MSSHHQAPHLNVVLLQANPFFCEELCMAFSNNKIGVS